MHIDLCLWQRAQVPQSNEPVKSEEDCCNRIYAPFKPVKANKKQRNSPNTGSNVKQGNNPNVDTKKDVEVKLAPVQNEPTMVKRSGRKLRGKKKKQDALQPSGSFEATFKPRQMCTGKVRECDVVHGALSATIIVVINRRTDAYPALDEKNQAYMSRRHRIGL